MQTAYSRSEVWKTAAQTLNTFILHLSWLILLCIQVIDPVCGRHTAVLKNAKVLLKLSNGPEEPEVMIVPRHKKFEGAGKKATTKTKVIYCCCYKITPAKWASAQDQESDSHFMYSLQMCGS